MLFYVFFFVKQKTAYELRISDWSSDVCSSDLILLDRLALQAALVEQAAIFRLVIVVPAELREITQILEARHVPVQHDVFGDIGYVFLGFERLLLDIDAIDQRLAASRLDEAEKAVDRRRLAGAVCPEHAIDLAGPDLEVQALQGDVGAIFFA